MALQDHASDLLTHASRPLQILFKDWDLRKQKDLGGHQISRSNCRGRKNRDRLNILDTIPVARFVHSREQYFPELIKSPQAPRQPFHLSNPQVTGASAR